MTLIAVLKRNVQSRSLATSAILHVQTGQFLESITAISRKGLVGVQLVYFLYIVSCPVLFALRFLVCAFWMRPCFVLACCPMKCTEEILPYPRREQGGLLARQSLRMLSWAQACSVVRPYHCRHLRFFLPILSVFASLAQVVLFKLCCLDMSRGPWGV